MKVPGFVCQRCQQPAPRRGMRQKYCVPCSEAANVERVKSNGSPRRSPERKARLAVRSLAVSEQSAGIADVIRPIEMHWVVRTAMPFSWLASKNAIYTLRRTGHVALRAQSKAWRDALTLSLRSATKGIEIKQNKLWIDIFVQKNNNRGDAVNMVDLVCDAIKASIDLDDRWYCIRRVDWEIVKHNGKIFVGIGQEDVPNVQVCSGCGQALSFDHFTKHARSKHGIGRECIECRSVARESRRAA